MKQVDFFAQRDQFFIKFPQTLTGFAWVAVFCGLVTFATGMYGQEHIRTWGSLLFNLMFFYSLSLGGVAFGNMQDIIGAKWGRPIKRVHESFGAFMPIGTFFILFFLVSIKLNILNAKNVYSWVADPEILHHFHGKDIWLQFDFMFVRDIAAALITLFLVMWHFKLTKSPDLALVNGDQAKAEDIGEKSRKKLRHWSAPVLVVYSLTFSLLTFDLTMSLAPTWFSTLWGGWSFAIMMQTLMAAILIFMFSIKDTHVGTYFSRQQYHDVGKLMFGFTVFFAYLTFAHVLTYWYGNVPEETSYFIRRLESPWVECLIASIFLSFLFPFFSMIPQVSKWSGAIAVPVACVVLFAQWMNYMVVVIPEVTPVSQTFLVPWIEIGIFFGFLGLFYLSIARFASKVPMLSIADPILKQALSEEH